MTGRTIVEALRDAQSSTELRERFLTTPMKFPAGGFTAAKDTDKQQQQQLQKQQQQQQRQQQQQQQRQQQQQQRQQTKVAKVVPFAPKKTKAEKKLLRKAAGAASSAPPWKQAPQAAEQGVKRSRGTMANGTKFCYKYQKGQCTRDQCPYVHVCERCEKGPLDCPQPGSCS